MRKAGSCLAEKYDKMSIQDKSRTVSETVRSCVEALKLKGVSTSEFPNFKRLKDLYGKQIGKKARHPKVDIGLTSLRASIKDDE